MYPVAVINCKRGDLFRVSPRIELTHTKAHLRATFLSQPPLRDLFHLDELFAILYLPAIEDDAQPILLGSFGARARICHSSTLERESLGVDDRVLADFEQMQAKRTIEIGEIIAHLPEYDGPILLVAEFDELLHCADQFAFGSDWIAGYYCHGSFQHITDDGFL